jgi:long-subunit acyl-CoA synthetase (AMP-forming)
VLPSLNALPLAPAGKALIPRGTSKITFTSGSTGAPKGVCLSSENCLNVATSLAQATGIEAPRHLCVLPLPVLLENIAGLYAPLLVDGCVLTIPVQNLGFEGSSGLDPAKFLSSLSRYRPTTLILVPQLLTVLDRALEMGWTAPDSLRFIAVGGARIAASLVERVRARGLPVYEGYGLSECASVVSVNCPGSDRPGTSGRVLNHLRVTDQGGQLRVAGNAFLGYLNQPETWYPEFVDTGDIGSVDPEGFVTIRGRAKTLLINSYGRNVSPEWVESELTAAGVFRQVFVSGDARPYCTALIHPMDETCSDKAVQAAIDQANRRLPDYARIRAWARLPGPLTEADGLLTANGRPRRNLIESTYKHLFEALYASAQELNIQ